MIKFNEWAADREGQEWLNFSDGSRIRKGLFDGHGKRIPYDLGEIHDAVEYTGRVRFGVVTLEKVSEQYVVESKGQRFGFSNIEYAYNKFRFEVEAQHQVGLPTL